MVSTSVLEKYYPSTGHPYRFLDRSLESHLTPTCTVLDIGCGRNAPVLRRLIDRVGVGIGVDPVAEPNGTRPRLLQGTASAIPLPNGSVDLAYSRSVLEHLEQPLQAFQEIRRVLRPGGRFFALTPNLWDYGSVAAILIPNRLHPWIVKYTEGRQESDTFPTYYRANTTSALRTLAGQSWFAVESVDYLNQYPAYLQFSYATFLLGVSYERVTSRFHSLRSLRGWLLASFKAIPRPSY
jgi:SAM-dependent methyltransferase